MTDDERKEFKEAVKEAAKEWLAEQFQAFGKWTAIGLASGAFYLAVKFMVVNNIFPPK